MYSSSEIQVGRVDGEIVLDPDAAKAGNCGTVLVPGPITYVLGLNHPSPSTCVTVTVGIWTWTMLGVARVEVEVPVIVTTGFVNIAPGGRLPVSSKPSVKCGKCGRPWSQ